MKVKELVKALEGLDPEAEVIVQEDAEGNGYSPLAGADPNAIYIPESTYSGMVYDADWDAADAGMEEDEWAEVLAKPRCVVLYPVN